MHRLQMVDYRGQLSTLLYDQHTSELRYEDGHKVIAREHLTDSPREVRAFERYWPLSPEKPNYKQHPRHLKIQLGLGCNYSCSYCLQAKQIAKASKTDSTELEAFLASIPKWTNPHTLEAVEFWGGEPLLYWQKIEQLLPRLREYAPKAEFSLITNGSLLTPEIVDQLISYNFRVAVSHDGPGQTVRGPDPLSRPEIVTQIQRLMTELPSFAINFVIHPKNDDPLATIRWFQARLPGVRVGVEGIVHDYHNDATAKFTPDSLHALTMRLSTQLIEHADEMFPTFQSKMGQVVHHLLAERPSDIVGQKCGMDDRKSLAVDLEGNILTCHNVGGKGEHKIGHVDSLFSARLNTSWHWSQRRECTECPVLQACQGACMYQDGQGWVNSCDAEFAYNLAFFITALYLITGKRFAGFLDPLLRPELRVA
jgi:uncharacterized protein